MFLFQCQAQQQQKIADMSTEERLAHQAQAWKQKTDDKPSQQQQQPQQQQQQQQQEVTKYRKLFYAYNMSLYHT